MGESDKEREEMWRRQLARREGRTKGKKKLPSRRDAYPIEDIEVILKRHQHDVYFEIPLNTLIKETMRLREAVMSAAGKRGFRYEGDVLAATMIHTMGSYSLRLLGRADIPSPLRLSAHLLSSIITMFPEVIYDVVRYLIVCYPAKWPNKCSNWSLTRQAKVMHNRAKALRENLEIPWFRDIPCRIYFPPDTPPETLALFNAKEDPDTGLLYAEPHLDPELVSMPPKEFVRRKQARGSLETGKGEAKEGPEQDKEEKGPAEALG